MSISKEEFVELMKGTVEHLEDDGQEYYENMEILDEAYLEALVHDQEVAEHIKNVKKAILDGIMCIKEKYGDK